VLKAAYNVLAVGRDELDITRLTEVESIFESFGPDVVVNCAGFTGVDACETQTDEARIGNAKGPENLARVANAHRCRIIHISTDYVFDGRKPVPEPYLEDDTPNPLSHYGLTKLESEDAVQRYNGPHVILRTAWLYGVKGGNFLKTILSLALADPKRELRVVNDQYGSPTWSRRVARQIERVTASDCTGIYHVTAEGYCTWYELAGYFLDRMEVPHRLKPCTSTQYPTPAERPKNSILENRRLKNEGINIMRPWKEDLDRFISDFRDRLIEECGE
jgi:dTDP-4-dehydrorhamnose reductase